MLGSLLEIERAVADALTGISPNCLLWGNLSAADFLTVVDDVTTWSLTHFEPVCAWSNAEDLSPVEEQEGYGIVGRLRRQCGPGEPSHEDRSLRAVTNPKVRGAALWVAHAGGQRPKAGIRLTGFMLSQAELPEFAISDVKFERLSLPLKVNDSCPVDEFANAID